MLIYLAQLTHKVGSIDQNQHFPLAIGLIGSCLKNKFGPKIEIRLFKFPEKLNTALNEKIPDVLMISNYMWNLNLSLAFAKKVKQQKNSVLTIMGGPNISLDASKQNEFLKRHTFIDFYVVGEGEYVAGEIIEEFFENRNISSLKQKSFQYTLSIECFSNACNKVQDSGDFGRISINEIPSPYNTGLMDEFFQDGLIPLIETNRGCPFTCTFCQQGNNSSKISYFNIDRIKAEITYISERIYQEKLKCFILEIADSNFAMYKRDKEIIEHIGKCQRKYEYPKIIYSSTGKNKWPIIIENIAPLTPESMIMRIAIQSMNQETLKAIKRANINLNSYSVILEYQQQKGIRCCADIMLGLPCETVESHMNSIYQLIDSGIDEFSLLQTIILRGTELEKDEFRKKYSIKSHFRPIPECVGMYDIMGDSVEVIEFEEIITSTSTLEFRDYLNMRKLHLIIMIFHNTGLLNPLYKLVLSQGFTKSDLIKSIIESNDPDFQILFDSFISETKAELIDTIDSVDMNDYSKNKYSDNKIYKYLAIAFFKNKSASISVAINSVSLILKGLSAEFKLELYMLLNNVMVDLNDNAEIKLQKLEAPELISVFGSQLSFKLSDNQRLAMESLDNIYKTQEEKLNRMVYKLRPANLCYSWCFNT